MNIAHSLCGTKMLRLTLFVFLGFTVISASHRLNATPDLLGVDTTEPPFSSTFIFDVVESSVAWGENVSIDFVLANLGSSPVAADSFTVRFYLSTDQTINTSDHPLTGHILIPSAISNGSAAPLSISSVALPPEQTIGGSGTFYIGMIVDSQNQISESDENNNSNRGAQRDRDSLTVTIPDPDLAGHDGRPTTQNFFDVLETSANWGDKINLKFFVENLTGGVADPFTVKFYLSPDNSFGDANDSEFASATFSSGLGGLLVGSFANFDYNELQLPNPNPLSGQPTTVYIGMVVDTNGEVTETDETNNKNQGGGLDFDATALTITDPQPDIQVLPASIDFGEIVNDGLGESLAERTLTINNNGKAPLSVSSIGITGDSSFKILSVISSTQDIINLVTLPRPIAEKNLESWIVTLAFDPETSTTLNGNLVIASDDPDEPSTSVSLTGVGLAVPDITITDSTAPDTDLTLNFGGVMVDGVDGVSVNQTVTVKNDGSGPLIVAQNGISITGGTQYELVSISSDTQGAINLSTGSATVAEYGAEMWTITVKFDPLTINQHDDGLEIHSDDPDEANLVVSLTGMGLTPMDIEVLDSSGTPTDLSIDFGGTHADGAGLQTSEHSFTVKNLGETPLEIQPNGIQVADPTHFQIIGIVSDINGTIDLSSNPAEISPNSEEVWTVNLAFDPTTSGNLATTVAILSNDPDENALIVNLAGNGLFEPDIVITDSVDPDSDLALTYGAILDDGLGERIAQETITLINIGADDLIVSQNGIVVTSGIYFEIASVVSSLDGTIDLSDPSDLIRTLSPAQAETWTITLNFDPQDIGNFGATLQINSNDPDEPQIPVALSGDGVQPDITLLNPEIGVTLNHPAESVFSIKWQDEYDAGNASISLYLDTDTDPQTGLIPIVSGIPEDSANDVHFWRPDVLLVGREYFFYATVSDGIITTDSYSPGKIKIDPNGSFQLLSPVKTTSGDYAYQYELNGQTYSGVTQLNSGNNAITVTTQLPGGGTAMHQFTVSRVGSLLHQDGYTYDELNRVDTFTNGNGIITTYFYDDMGRLEKTTATSGNVVEYKYDALSRLTQLIDSTGTTFYDLDELNRLTGVTYSKNGIKGDGDDRNVSYTHYLDNKLDTITYPNGETIKYTYDAAGRLKTVDNQTLVQLTTYEYDYTTGQLDYLERPNGIRTLYGYDAMGRVDLVRHERIDANPIGQGELVAEFDYDLNNLGFATWLTKNLPLGISKKEHYIYDDLDRLTTAIYSQDSTLDPLNLDSNDLKIVYTYDSVGNRLSLLEYLDGQSLKDYTYQYGNENRLLRIIDENNLVIAEYVYDSAGNRRQKITVNETVTYTYNEQHNLISITDNDSYTTFLYNGKEIRVGKNENGVEQSLIASESGRSPRILSSHDGQGNWIYSTTYGKGKISKHDYNSGNTTYYLTDRLGSVRLITDSAGVVISIFDYDAFGKVFDQ